MREDEDAAVIAPEAELVGCTEHPFGDDAQDATTLDGHAVRHRSAEGGEGDDIALAHVERTAPHVPLGAVTGVDVHTLDLGGVGVLFEAQHACRDDTIHGATDAVDALDGETERRHGVGQPLDRDVVVRVGEIAVLVEPGKQYFHRVRPSSKRTTVGQDGRVKRGTVRSTMAPARAHADAQSELEAERRAISTIRIVG